MSSKLTCFKDDNKLTTGIIEKIMTESSLAAAIYDSRRKLLVSTPGWHSEYKDSSVKTIIDEALAYMADSGSDFSAARSFVAENKSLVCFPVLTTNQDLASVFVIREIGTNKTRNILKVYHDIFENFEEGYFELDLKGNLVYCNEKISEITGIDRNDLQGINFRTYTTKATADQLFAVYTEIFRTGKPSKISDFEVIKKDGTKVVFEVSSGLLKDDNGLPIGFRGICRDASERIKIENEKRLLSEQLQQAQRFEAVATLAGGIAHDFNNLLMSIQGNISLLQLLIDPSSRISEYLKKIETQVERGASLTRQMLGISFSEIQPSNSGNIDITALLKTTAVNVTSNNPKIELKLALSSDSFFVNCDYSQIEKVFLNLISNACSAMPDGGVLSVSTLVEFCSEERTSVFRMRPGQYLNISIADTGFGMDETTKRRVFNPFFTTSENGKNSGLGLTTAFGIIKNIGGFITVSSELGTGTEVNVFLPLSVIGVS